MNPECYIVMLIFAGSCALLRDVEVQPGPLLPLLRLAPVARPRAGTPQGAEYFMRISLLGLNFKAIS